MDQMMPPGTPSLTKESAPESLIKSVEVTKLFGQFYYEIDLTDPMLATPASRRLTLLYGDNGSGKTTILNLLWNALSASPLGAHRSYLGNCPFATLTIQLNNGDSITVEKAEDLQGPFHIRAQGTGVDIIQRYATLDDDSYFAIGEDGQSVSELSRREMEYRLRMERRTRDSRAPHASRRAREQLALFADQRNDAFVDYLNGLNANPHFLADDRQIYGDDLNHHLKNHRSVRDVEEEGPNDTKSFLGKELGSVMRRVHMQFQQQVIRGNQQGSRGTNKIYLDILARIAQRDFNGGSHSPIETLLNRLNDLAVRTQKYAEFGLVPALRSQPFASLLSDIPTDKSAVAEEVILPYLEAQETRLDALKKTEQLIRTLVEQANGFLRTKRLVFDLSRGMRVVAYDSMEQELGPHQLSSGERQILLLLSNTVLARGNTKLFLIDEPELSLNVKWQRKLMSALLACTEGSGMQFVVATHSVEVITGNKDSLSRLVSKS
ncbi:AAA family ATPase [Streptomyces sp. 35G-GA-8]|uniref:AAA family ATPase n=1 Tax=Streptomyces sp. 35G-GA-8 TaxID=2939434 RepID=UPI00201F0887|nr:AAA family ATPase [Streptomyces sp. 35G-GA-8]MCL7379635.1 AAA family ATPase [Streptomyces sp. 35G-GA-8]